VNTETIEIINNKVMALKKNWLKVALWHVSQPTKQLRIHPTLTVLHTTYSCWEVWVLIC